MITGAQIRAGRALVRWSAEDLAKESKLGVATVRRAEMSDGLPTITEVNGDAMQRALEQAGVIFVPGTGEGPGVRLRKTPMELSEKIADLHEALPVVDDNAKPSPQKAMKQLQHAHVKNEIAKAKDKHTKLVAKSTKPKSQF